MTEQENAIKLVVGLLDAAKHMLDVGRETGTESSRSIALAGSMIDAHDEIAKARRTLTRALSTALLARTGTPEPRTLASDIAEDRH